MSSIYWYFLEHIPRTSIEKFLVYASNGQYAPAEVTTETKIAVGFDFSALDTYNVVKYLAVAPGKGVSQSLLRVLEALSTDPNALLSRVVLANIVSRELVAESPSYVGMIHEVVAKSTISFGRDSVYASIKIGKWHWGSANKSRRVQGEWGKSFSNAVGLALAALTSGLSRLGYELRAGAAQALIAGIISERLERDSMGKDREVCHVISDVGATLIASLFADLYTYFPIAIIHFKKPGVLRRELAEAILARQLLSVVNYYEEHGSREDVLLTVERVFSKACMVARTLEGMFVNKICNARKNDPKSLILETYKEIMNVLRDAMNDAFEIKSNLEPLVGRAVSILDRVDSPGSAYDNIVVTLTGQTTGPFIRILTKMVDASDKPDSGRNIGVHVVYTPYTYLNMLSVVEEYGNLWAVPIMDADPKISYTAGRALARRIAGSSGRSDRFLVLLQGSYGSIFPFLAGLRDALGKDDKERVNVLML